MKNKLIIFEGHEFENSKQLSLWTEERLQEYQYILLSLRDNTDYDSKKQVRFAVRKMYKYIRKYAKSLLLKNFRSYILDVQDLNKKAYLVAKEVLMQYYKRPEFKITASFGGYIGAKTKQIMFTFKQPQDSCANYISIESKTMEIDNCKFYVVDDIDSIVPGTFKISVSKYNKNYNYWEDFELIARDTIKKEIVSLDTDFKCNICIINYKLKSFFIEISNFDSEDYKLRIELKGKVLVNGISLSTPVACSKTNERTITLGEILQIEDLNSRLDTNIERFDLYDINNHIYKMINETSKYKYCFSKKLNLHRLIALRNRLEKGEEWADDFFNIYSLDARGVYDQTVRLIYRILKDYKEGN